MDREETMRTLTPLLLSWYRSHARDLPWRQDPTPYRVWVSEIMLQQTRVAAVVDYFRRFMAALPEIADLAAVPEDALLKLWQGLGYYNRARNLQRAARQIMRNYQGVFPSRYEDIRGLVGVGDYTAGAIASIAFGIPVPAVDGNVLRVLARILGDDRDIGLVPVKRDQSALVQAILPQDEPGTFNQALMELGATVCLPNGTPLCGECPVKEYCFAYMHKETARLPVKAGRKARKVEERRVFLLFHNGKVALRKRPDTGLLASLWEYPNELTSQPDPLPGWGIEVLGLEPICKGKHLFTHIEWHMEAVAVLPASDRLPQGWVWAGRQELERVYALPNAFHFVREEVRKRLGKEDAAS